MSKTIQISDETWEKIKDQVGEEEAVDISSLDELVGKAWFFRTVTYHIVGKVKRQVGSFLFLKDAAWVADSGRFMQAIKDGTLNEVEPVGEWTVNLDTVTDFGPWRHKLPLSQK